MVRLLKNSVQCCLNAMPLREELFQNQLAFGGKPVEAFVPFVFLAPLAGEKSLTLQPAKQRIQGPFVDIESMLLEGLTQRVPILFGSEGREHRQTQASATQLETKVFKGV